MQIKKSNLIATVSGLCISMVFPLIAFAQVTIGSMATAIAGQIYVVGVALVFIAWIVTGILYLISVGDPGRLKSANVALIAAIAGTIIIILSNIACAFVGNSFKIGSC